MSNKLLQEVQQSKVQTLRSADVSTGTKSNQSQFGETIEDKVNRVLNVLERRVDLFAQKLSRAEMSLRLHDLIHNDVSDIGPEIRQKVVLKTLDYLYGYGVIQELMDDPNVSDIQINGSHYIRYVDARTGDRVIFDRNFESDEAVIEWVQNKLKGTPFRYDRSNPNTDAFLADGSRLHVKGEVVGVQGLDPKGRSIVKPCTIVTIRKFLGFYTLEELVKKQLIDARAYEYLKISATIRYGFVLSGGTGSGKTTLMNALISLTDESKQIGILEEAPELNPNHPFITRYWERPENTEGRGRIGTDLNLKHTLRMFLDDMYVGEIRDAFMAYNFLQAANTGSGRVGTTLHATTTKGAANRLMNLAAGSPEKLGQNAIWDNIRNSIHMFIQIERYKNQRRVVEICEIDPEKITGEVKLIPVFTFKWEGLNERGLPDGRLLFHGLTKRFQSECAKWGIEIPKELMEKDVDA